MNNELNRKLAEWVRITQEQIKDWIVYPTGEKVSVEGKPLEIYPNFTECLDACFKWLVPNWNTKEKRLQEWVENITFSLMSGDLVRCTIQQFDVDKDTWAEAETPALALCLAVEKLIDGE